MSVRPARVAVVILAASLVAVAAGCGGGGGGKKTTSSTTSQMHETTTMSSETTTASGSSASSFASAKNCQDLAGIAAKAASAIEATSGNPATALQKEAQILQGLANAAPSDIRADFQTVAAAFTSFLQALEKAGFKPGETLTSPPTATQIAALTKAAQSFDTAKVKQAEQNLTNWVDQNCKGVKVGG